MFAFIISNCCEIPVEVLYGVRSRNISGTSSTTRLRLSIISWKMSRVTTRSSIPKLLRAGGDEANRSERKLLWSRVMDEGDGDGGRFDDLCVIIRSTGKP
jgi:hypothetical protein